MQKFLCILGLSLSFILPTYADNDLLNKGTNHHDCDCCMTSVAKLYAWSEGSVVQNLISWETLDTTYYDAEFNYYVPFLNRGVAQGVLQLDESTFILKRKGVYEFTYTLSKWTLDDETAAVFAIELVDSFGSIVVPGSTMSFSNQTESDVPWKTMSVQFYVEENNTAVRIGDLSSNGQDVELYAAGQDGVYASLTIVQLATGN